MATSDGRSVVSESKEEKHDEAIESNFSSEDDESDEEFDEENYGKDFDYDSSDDCESEEQRAQVHLYRKQFEESEGFDMGPFTTHLPVIGATLSIDYTQNERIQKMVEHCIKFAIADNDEEKDTTKVELVKILKVINAPRAGLLFYITLKLEKSIGNLVTYQTQVFYGIGECHGMKDTHVTIFREKTQQN